MLYSLPFIAAIIGWFTNYIAVKMLFHPREKKKFLFFEVQGVFPKRQKVLAERLGNIVATELFSMKDLEAAIASPETTGDILKVVDDKLQNFLDNKIAQSMPMLAMFLNDDIKNKIKTTILAEFEDAIPELTSQLSNKLQSQVDIKQIVEEKVSNFSSEKLEQIIFSIMKKEFRFIEILGGILGFIIGVVQLLIVMFGS